jgi:hypothetical protein
MDSEGQTRASAGPLRSFLCFLAKLPFAEAAPAYLDLTACQSSLQVSLQVPCVLRRLTVIGPDCQGKINVHLNQHIIK